MANLSRKFACVLIGLSVIVAGAFSIIVTIRSEGEKTREAMSRIADAAVQTGVEQVIDLAEDTPVELAETVSEQSQRMASELAGATKTVFGEIREILWERDQQNPSSLPQASPSPPPLGDRPNSATPVDSLRPGNLIGEIFRAGREATRSLDRIGQEVLKLDTTEERQLGESLNRLICEEHPILNEPRISTRLESLAVTFLDQRKRKDVDYTFVIVDSPEVNAFAHAGGFVYVHTGLLEFVRDEGELQFVLGHEIAHVDLRHCVEQLTYASRASQGAGEVGGSLVRIAYQLIALGYSEDKEFEADAWAYVLLGDSKPSALRFLERLAQDGGEPKVEQSAMTALDVAVHEVDNHFRTHPSTAQRLIRLRN